MFQAHRLGAIIAASIGLAAISSGIDAPPRRSRPRTGKVYPYSSERQNTRMKRKRLRAEAKA